MSKSAQVKTRKTDMQRSDETSGDSGKIKNREDEQDIRDARRALKEARKKGSTPWERVKREVGI